MVGGSQIWLGGVPPRRLLVPAVVIALGLAVAAGVALGTTGEPAQRAAAQTRPAPADPSYLLPVGTLIMRDNLPKPTLRGDQGQVGVPQHASPRPTTPVDLSAGDTAARYSGAAGTLTPAGIATLAMQRGCRADQAVIATSVAMAESGGSPSAQGDVTLMDATWDWSAGLWQVRGLKAQRNTGQLRDSVANQNAVKNSAAMYAISSGCTNWSPWTTYNTGAYRSYLGVATQAVRYVLRYYAAHHAYPTVAPPDPDAPVPVPAGGAIAAAGGNPAAASSATRAGRPAATRSSSARTSSSGSNTSAESAGDPGSGSRGGGSSAATRSPAKPSPSPSSSRKKILPSLPVPTKPIGDLTDKVKSALPTLPAVPHVTLPKLPGI